MSIQEKIDNIITSRNTIRDKFVDLEMASSDSNLNELAEAASSFSLDEEVSEQDRLLEQIIAALNEKNGNINIEPKQSQLLNEIFEETVGDM